MKIKVLNKNMTHPDSTSGFFEVDEGAVITQCYNETLDSGVVTISNLSEKIKLEPYDVVEFDSGNKMCIDTYNEVMLCVNPKSYKYEIHLFSETKQLENTVLPNLKITKVWGETRSLYDYINQYMTEYCPYIRISTGSSTYSYQPLFKWTDNSSDEYSLARFKDVECPEMQWNTPTLREVINDLMMVADCIPIIKHGHLYYLDLTVTKNNISNDSHINYVTRSKSSEDYISELQVPLVNVTNNQENTNNVVTKVEYHVFDSPDNEAVLTSNNLFVKTDYPIYKLKSVKMMIPTYANCAPVPVTQGGTLHNKYIWVEADLMALIGSDNQPFNLICEYQEWITKRILYNDTAPTNFEDWTKYQNWSLYYTRGSNQITNFPQNNKFLWMSNFLRTNLEYRIRKKFLADLGDNYIDSFANSNFYAPIFKVEYETLEGCVFRASKGDVLEHERVVIDNQTNSFVDSYSQGFLEYQKANRLGNEQVMINARYNSNETLMEIGDIFEDSIIYQCQYQYYKNHVEVNAQATKNYVLREYFTGVKSKIRSWAIVSGAEALTRHDLFKYYCEFSWNEHKENYGLTSLALNNVAKYMLSPLEDYTAKPLKYSFVRTTDGDNNYPAKTGDIKSYYTLDLMTRVIGNSLVLTFEFLDNYWAGKSFHTSYDPLESSDKYISIDNLFQDNNKLTISSTNSQVSGGIPTYQHRYTDDNGEFQGGEIVFSDGIKVIPAITTEMANQQVDLYFDDIVPGDYWTNGIDNATMSSQTKNYLMFVYQRPRVYENNFKWSGVQSSTNDYNYEKIRVPFVYHKDSQEITNISTQFEFSTDTTDICFSKLWLSNQQAVSTSDNNVSGLLLKMTDSSNYNFRRPDELPNASYSTVYITPVIANDGNLNAYVKLYDFSDGYLTYAEAKARAETLFAGKALYLMQSYSATTPLLALNNVPLENCVAQEVSDQESLPSGYTRLEYIQNSGTQYLNLGFVPNTDTNDWWSFSLDYMDISASGSNYVMGSRTSGGTIYFGVTGASATKAITIANTTLTIANNYRKANRRYNAGASYKGSNNGTCGLYNITDDEFYDGEQNVSLSGSTANVCLFALNSSNIHSGMRVYGLTVYKGSTLIRDLVPARNSSNVLGMYDRANDVFYTNAGSGTFIAGPEITGNSYYPAVKFYLNVLRTRNKNIYDNDNHYLIVDKI